MKKQIPILLSCAGLAIVGCQKNNRKDEQVISQRYIHQYGYDVSQDEWESSQYPGQVITTLKDGITIMATYENGVLHGPTTYTFPHSQTKESIEYYDRGKLVKKVSHSIRGVPLIEELYLSPVHLKVTKWFSSGCPMSVEEFDDGKLVFGEYLNKKNETIGQINKGDGTRFIRDEGESVIAKELYQDGMRTFQETYYANGSPHVMTPYRNGQIHGEKKLFASTGEPLSIESYSNGKRHGLSSYYQNAAKYLELTYNNDLKDGPERHYIDGETLCEETYWSQGKKHGPSTFFSDGLAKVAWYYNHERVPKHKFNELTQRELDIAEMSERSRPKKHYE